MQGTIQRRHLIGFITITILIFVTLKLGGSHYCKFTQGKNIKIEYVCIEDPETQNRTGLEVVKSLPVHLNEKATSPFNPSEFKNMDFSISERSHINDCVKNSKVDFKKGHDAFWHGDTQSIRRTHHSYLVPGESIMIEVGGNVGEDAEEYLKMYKPKHLVILEPLKLLYRKLGQRFRNNTNVMIYNVGLGKKYEKIFIKMEGNFGDATSPFFGSGEGSCSLNIVNAIDFFKQLGVGSYKVDLLTINCEGCEYDLLEIIVSTNLIYHFKHIQFALHPTLKNLPDPYLRYCKLQEWLRRTHQLTYQYKFTWETWKLKDL